MIPILSKRIQEILGTCFITIYDPRKNGKTQKYEEMTDKICRVLDYVNELERENKVLKQKIRIVGIFMNWRNCNAKSKMLP